MKIMILLPQNDSSSEWFFYHLLPFLGELGERNIDFQIAMKGGSNICEVRESCLGADFGVPLDEVDKPWDGKIDYTHLLWIDSDVLFTIEHFDKLLAWDKEIVCGLYLKNQQGDFAPAKYIEKFEQSGVNNIWSLNAREIVGKKGLIETLTVSMGFSLFKKGVFESLKRPWFPSMPVKMPGGKKLFCGEDVCLSFNLRRHNYHIYCDTGVIIPHRKASGWFCTIPDSLPDEASINKTPYQSPVVIPSIEELLNEHSVKI
jgi:hypothetical protein